MTDGIREIPIEERGGGEVRWMEGVNEKGEITKVKILSDESPVSNYGFDVTPARLITGLITERGICRADRESILGLFPENRQ
jgi:methylthioribose-1-phosphate isomerase